MELVYQHELTTLPDCLKDAHHGKTGYFRTVTEVPELIKTGEYTGESANWGNWCLWTDCLSALNHWLMRYRFGTEAWKQRKDTERHCLVGIKLDCTKLVSDMICKELSTFNRLYWAHCITGKNSMILTESERLCIIALDLKKAPTLYLRETRTGRVAASCPGTGLAASPIGSALRTLLSGALESVRTLHHLQALPRQCHCG